jgi:hypothetical protein
MAESTLTTDYAELRIEAARVGGLSVDSSDWSTEESNTLDRVLKRAMRKSYFPASGYDWRFLVGASSGTSITTFQSITGTISSETYDASTYSAVVLTTSVFTKECVGHNLVVSGGGTYVIDSYTSATTVNVVGDTTGETGTVTITGDDTFRAPDNFTELLDRMWFDGSQGRDRQWVEQRSMDQIEQMRSDGIEGIPYFVGIEPTTNYAGQQRYDLVLYPEPDAAYVLKYRYKIQPDVITSASPYAYGPAWFANVLVEAMRSEAEMEFWRAYGQHKESFDREIMAAEVRDRKSAPKTLGPMNAPSRKSVVSVSWPRTNDISY